MRVCAVHARVMHVILMRLFFPFPLQHHYGYPTWDFKGNVVFFSLLKPFLFWLEKNKKYYFFFLLKSHGQDNL